MLTMGLVQNIWSAIRTDSLSAQTQLHRAYAVYNVSEHSKSVCICSVHCNFTHRFLCTFSVHCTCNISNVCPPKYVQLQSIHISVCLDNVHSKCTHCARAFQTGSELTAALRFQCAQGMCLYFHRWCMHRVVYLRTTCVRSTEQLTAMRCVPSMHFLFCTKILPSPPPHAK